MSAIDVKTIIYHCECRRFVEGTPAAPCTCTECGQMHVPTEEYGGIRGDTVQENCSVRYVEDRG